MGISTLSDGLNAIVDGRIIYRNMQLGDVLTITAIDARTEGIGTFRVRVRPQDYQNLAYALSEEISSARKLTRSKLFNIFDILKRVSESKRDNEKENEIDNAVIYHAGKKIFVIFFGIPL